MKRKQLKLKKQPQLPLDHFEKGLINSGYNLIAGVDEVGRGCLAGPVVAAAVVLDPDIKIEGITDSKRLTPNRREFLFGKIRDKCIAYGIASVSSQRIDSINILQASLEAMQIALNKLTIKPNYILIDGNQPIKTQIPQKTIIKGDSLSVSIAAASIMAKVYRDKLMVEYCKKYSGFSFNLHKGYGTKAHLIELETNGPTEIHRMTFSPVKTFVI